MKGSGRCGLCVLLAILAAVQMVSVSGMTVFADGTETPIVPSNPDVRINGLSLVLNGEIGLTFYVYVAKPYRNGTMEFTFMNEEPITMNITDCPVDSSTHRFMATYYLSAIELSEPVTLSVYAADDTEHDDPLAQASCSAEEYVCLLKEDGKAAEKEKNVGITLINYGHFAQLACSETNGWTVGRDYRETEAFGEPTVDPSVFDGYRFRWNNPTEDVHHFTMSLDLGYQIGIFLYIASDRKPSVTVNGKEAEVSVSSYMKDCYELAIRGISALHPADEYQITIDGVTLMLSAFSYCEMAVRSRRSRNTVDAMRALYEFYQATVAYHAPEGR